MYNCLHLHKVEIQRRAMGLIVVQERARWLNLTTLSTKEKVDLLDTLISAQGLFVEMITLMQKRCVLADTASGLRLPFSSPHTFSARPPTFPGASTSHCCTKLKLSQLTHPDIMPGTQLK